MRWVLSSTLTQPLSRRLEQHFMGFIKNGGNPFGKRTSRQRGAQIQMRNLRRVLARKPVVPLAEQVVAHLRPVHQSERFRMHPKTQDFEQIDLSGNIDILRQTLEPTLAPVRPEAPV